MANRPVFIAWDKKPYVRKADVTFTFHSGFAAVQKQKNIEEIHAAFKRMYSSERVLEISSKSTVPEGVRLSAFNLKKYVPSKDRRIAIENIFQAGKVFSEGGPYTDLLDVPQKQAKRDERLRSSGKIIAFEFEGEKYPTKPETAFYDFLYITAILEDEELCKALLEYSAFTDIEFNPNKSLNCQASAAAKFVGLHKAGLLEEATKSFEAFVELAY